MDRQQGHEGAAPVAGTLSGHDQVDPEVMLPDLFRAYPGTRAVFDRWGLRGCGGPTGPAESIRFFAEAHGVPLGTLLSEVSQAIRQASESNGESLPLQGALQPRLVDSIYRPFFLSAIAIMLTAGAGWGVWLLWQIGVAGSLTGVSVHEVNAHGHAQIMGWVGLFIMGFAYQAFPRMWQVELPAPPLAFAAGAVMLASIVARSTAMVFSGASWSLPVHHMAAAGEIAAVSVFAAQVVVAFRRSGQAIEPYVAFIFAAIGFFLIQTLYGSWHIAQLLGAPSRDALLGQVAAAQASLRDLQIHGMALLMIIGVSIRMFPAIFGLPEVPRGCGWVAWGVLMAAVLLEVALMWAYQWSGAPWVAGLLLIPWLLLPVGAGLIVGPWRLWRRLPERGRGERSGKFIRMAYGWLFFSFAMLLLLPVYHVISGLPFSHAYYGAVRHAITVGCVTMMIVGMSAKVVPTLCGIPPEQLPRLWVPFVLLNLGCLLRVVLQVASDWSPWALQVIGVSGTLEWIGLAFWGAHVGRVMLVDGFHPAAGTGDDWGPVPERLLPTHRVAAVLAWHPELEEVFVAHGFPLIRQPILRRTVARHVSLEQACQLRHVDLAELLAALEQRRDRHEPLTQLTLPV